MRTPARKLRKSAVKNIVRFPAIKANFGNNILVESILESKFCLHLEFDSRVLSYFPQPKTFQLTDKDKSFSYTPDFEVNYVDGTCAYVEVKPLKFSETPHFQRVFSVFAASLQHTNAEFVLVDENHIHEQPLLSNYEQLYQYLKRPSIDMRRLNQCAENICGSMTLSCLIGELKDTVDLREIYSWLAIGYLEFDIRAEQISMATEVRFDVH